MSFLGTALEAVRHEPHYVANALLANSPAALSVLQDSDAARMRLAREVGVLTAELEALRAELDRLQGKGHRAQRGCLLTTKQLGDADVLVEYETQPKERRTHFHPGHEGSVSIVQVFVNGTWCDPDEFVADAVLESWRVELCEAMDAAAAEPDEEEDDDGR